MTHSFPTRRSSELVGHAIDADDLEIVGVLPDHRQPIVAEIHELGGQRQRPFAGGQRTDVLDMRRSEEHTSELQSLMRISYAVFCLKKKNKQTQNPTRLRETQDDNHNIITAK